MAEFKPAYLIHGDDHGRIAERRARLRSLAESDSGSGGLEVLEGEAATVEDAAAALCAMSLAIGRRFVIVEGVERWKDSEMGPLEAALAGPGPDTTIAFFGREEGRAAVPKRLIAAVKKAGGVVSAERTVKPWDLPDWVQAQAAETGVEVHPAAARALVRLVGERQQRLLREVEKIALEVGPGVPIDLALVESRAASSAERRAWTLADALVGRDGETAARTWLELQGQGERLQGLIGLIAKRVRMAAELAERLDAGEAPSALKSELRMPRDAKERLVRDVQASGPQGMRSALGEIADLEAFSHGGGGAQGEETAVVRAIAAIATPG